MEFDLSRSTNINKNAGSQLQASRIHRGVLLQAILSLLQNQKTWRIRFGKIITLLQVTADALIIFGTYLTSYWFYTEGLGGWSPQTLTQFIGIAAIVSFLYIVILDRVGLYQREVSLLNIKELRGITHASLYAAAIILSLSFYIRSLSLSRIMFTSAIVVAPIALYLERYFFYRAHLLFHRRGWSERRVFIYGAGNIGIQLAKRMFESPSLGLLPIGFLDDEASKQGQVVTWATGPKQGLPVLGGDSWIERCSELAVELIFIALPSATLERNQKLIERCVAQRLEYAIVPNAFGQFIQDLETLEIGGIPILRQRKRRVSYAYLISKRLLDFVFSTILIVIFSPLVFLIGILIKLDTPGPVFFKQKRAGLNGKEFTLYKFRSMHTATPQYALTPTSINDDRITKTGRWIRRSSLDELPQLFNVFRGDMSLVGPRPEMPFIVSQYSALEQRRLEARPGITGVWQISAVRGEPIHANLEYDLFYLENRSLLLDFTIFVKTGLSVIRGIGAI